MMVIFAFLLGGCVGAVLACLAMAQGNSEAYMQGYEDGLKVGAECGKE